MPGFMFRQGIRPAHQKMAMHKFITTIDSFKGCMTSHEANMAARSGLQQAYPGADVRSFDVSDGGEGFLEAMRCEETVACRVHDALMRPTDSAYGIKDGKAVIEVARAVGLAMIEPEQRNPWAATSYGVGELVADAWRRGCREFVVGLGGSATSDCGLGMLKCLKHEWQRANNKMWYEPFDTSWLRGFRVTLATDVTNPLCGETGAARVFAPQKGADGAMVERIERRARTFAAMAARHQGRDMSREPGAGAAGGLGYAFMQFMDTTVVSGAETVLEAADFDSALDNLSDGIVVTGEGASDSQTLMGKLPSVVLRHAKARGVPVALVAGRIRDRAGLRAAGFDWLVNINDGQPEGENALDKDVAMRRLAAVFASGVLQWRENSAKQCSV